MKTLGFTLVQPEMLYLVIKQVTWTGDYIIDGFATNTGGILQHTASPTIKAFAGSLSDANNNLIVNTYAIVRLLFNGVNSKLQVNETSAITGDFGAADMGGFTLGSKGNGLGNWTNIEATEIIGREVVDSAGDDQIIYDYLVNKYGI